MDRTLYVTDLNASECGIIAMKATDAGGVNEIELDREYGAEGSKKTPEQIITTNVYSYENPVVTYTLCLTGIPDSEYDTQYIVRGYMIYTDNNNTERMVYTSPYTSSINETVTSMLADQNVHEATKASLKTRYNRN